MRHGKSGVKLNRTSSHRKAMFRNMVTSLFKYDRIKTTDAKAKELRKWADHLITLAKRGDLHAKRQAFSIIREREVVSQLFEGARKRFGDRQGGYTRIIKLGRRPGDAAPISLIELVEGDADSSPGSKLKKRLKQAVSKAKDQPAPLVEEAGSSGDTTEEQTVDQKPSEPDTDTAPQAETASEPPAADETVTSETGETVDEPSQRDNSEDKDKEKPSE